MSSPKSVPTSPPSEPGSKMPAGGQSQPPAASGDSMSMLAGLLFDPLNYGYSATEEQTRPLTAYEKLLVFLIAVVLASASTVAVKSLVSSRSEKEATHQQLLQRVREEQTQGEELLGQIHLLEAEIKGLAAQEVTFAEVPTHLLTASHAARVTGPGLVITLKNGNPDIPDGAVQDQDLRLVLNSLWASGAEGIAINGLRIGPRTPVRTAGSTVLVNFQPVSGPYEIAAIGDTERLARGVTTGSTGGYFADLYKDFGIVLTVAPATQLDLPALRLPKINLQSIKVVEEAQQ